MAFAHEYAATVDDGRDADIPIIRCVLVCSVCSLLVEFIFVSL